jgi:hypothetical protein
LTGTYELAYDPAPKEVALTRDYLTTYGPERSAFVMRHAAALVTTSFTLVGSELDLVSETSA